MLLLQVQIILKFFLILGFAFSEYSGIGNVLSSSLYFLSNNPFNLSYTVEGASFIWSKITHLPFFIALTRNPSLNFKISLLCFLSLFSFVSVPLVSLSKFFDILGTVIPIKSSHCNFFEQMHRYESCAFLFSSLQEILENISALHLATWVIPEPSFPTIITCLWLFRENTNY